MRLADVPIPSLEEYLEVLDAEQSLEAVEPNLWSAFKVAQQHTPEEVYSSKEPLASGIDRDFAVRGFAFIEGLVNVAPGLDWRPQQAIRVARNYARLRTAATMAHNVPLMHHEANRLLYTIRGLDPQYLRAALPSEATAPYGRKHQILFREGVSHTVATTVTDIEGEINDRPDTSLQTLSPYRRALNVFHSTPERQMPVRQFVGPDRLMLLLGYEYAVARANADGELHGPFRFDDGTLPPAQAESFQQLADWFAGHYTLHHLLDSQTLDALSASDGQAA